MNQYLQHANGFVKQCGTYIDSPLLTINPVARQTYQHLDYRPLVNARVHQLGRRRQILITQFLQKVLGIWSHDAENAACIGDVFDAEIEINRFEIEIRNSSQTYCARSRIWSLQCPNSVRGWRC